MEGYEITVKQTLHNFKTILVNPEVRGAGKRRVEVKADVCLFELLLDKEWNHYQVVVVHPNRLAIHLKLILSIQQILDLNNLVSKHLIHISEIFPILQIFTVLVIQIFEVVEQGSDDILVEP